jgi:hypothetical protein
MGRVDPTLDVPDSDAERSSAASAPPKTSSHRARRVIAWVLIVLAALLIPVATTAVWATRTVLNEDRFTSTVSDVASDPNVISVTSTFVTDQIAAAVAGTGVLDRLPANLRPAVAFLAGALRQRVEERVNDVLSSDAGQELLVGAATRAHRAAMRLLQGDGLLSGSAFTVEQGKITLNLLPVVRTVLLRLQQDGVVPASVEIPAPDAPPGQYAAALRARLGDDFGQVVVYDTGTASNDSVLDDAQRALVILKRAVVLLVLLGLAVAVVAVLVAVDRRRAVFRVGLAVAIGCVVLAIVARRVSRAVPSAVSTTGARTVAATLADSLRSSLVRALLIVAAVAVITAVVVLQHKLLARWSAAHANAARFVAVAIGLLVLLVLGLGWGSLLFAVIVTGLGLLLVEGAVRAGPRPSLAEH